MPNILFLHQNGPAQFRHLAGALARQEGNRVVFLTTIEGGMPAGVEPAVYKPAPVQAAGTTGLRRAEAAVREGQAALQAAAELKKGGFHPDIVIGHSGWGSTLFMKEVFPETPLLCYFEWFYHLNTALALAAPGTVPGLDERCGVRLRNGPILNDLVSCDRGYTPTEWQKRQFPPEFGPKIEVLHDGIDTEYYQPSPAGGVGDREVVTYVARGMEPCRGFPEFMTALALLQRHRPRLEAIVVGADRVAYGDALPDGQSYRKHMLGRLDLDESRVHFTGLLPPPAYRKVLQASSVHVYLTRPFVLSWSVLEAMACGCLVVGSRTPPVEEVIRDGENGLLVALDDPEAIAERIASALDRQAELAPLRAHARQTILGKYALRTTLERQQAIVGEMLGRR